MEKCRIFPVAVGRFFLARLFVSAVNDIAGSTVLALHYVNILSLRKTPERLCGFENITGWLKVQFWWNHPFMTSGALLKDNKSDLQILKKKKKSVFGFRPSQQLSPGFELAEA